MNRFFHVLFAFTAVGPLLAKENRCATATFFLGTSCKDSQVEFDLSKCAESNKRESVSTICQGQKAVAILATESAKYTAAFKPDGSWGEAQWNLESLSITKLSSLPKKAAPVANKLPPHPTPLELAQLPAPSETKEKEVEREPTGEPAKEEDMGEGKLTGNWKGFRNKIAKVGLSLGLTYGAEPSYNFTGGIEKTGTYMGKALLSIDEDLSKLLNWNGGSLHVGIQGTHGKGPSAYVGDTQVTSNIDALPTLRFYEAWFQQSVLDDTSSFRIGMYDFNSEFYVTETALVFLNSSFGIGVEASQSPVNGSMSPSVFPAPSVGGRFRVNAGKNTYFLLGILDGVPGDPNDAFGTKVYFNKADGLFLPAEFGFTWGREDNSTVLPGKFLFGAWAYTQAVNTIQPQENDAIEKAVSHGFYTSFEQTVVNYFSLFLRYGMASKDVNQIASNLSAGIVFSKVLPFWDNDQLGFGISTAFNGADYLESQEAAGTPSDSSETAFEVLYRFEVVPGFSLQPDLQYVMNPGTDPTLEDAFVGALRADFDF